MTASPPQPDGPGPVALVGSGEFLDAMLQTDTALLDGRPKRVAVVPTAAAPEGEASLRRWLDLAHRHYGQLGAEVIEVPAIDRSDADDPRWARAIDGAGLIYLSGGNPHHLAESLVDSPLWAAIATAWAGGAALAGCSAGAMALAETVVSFRGVPARPGMGAVPGICVLPHFDKMRNRFADIAATAASTGKLIVGIDEDTALVSTGHISEPWRVKGRAGVHVLQDSGAWTSYGRDDLVALPH